jgi:hypothetical protein
MHRAKLEQAVAAIPGVAAVESYLHIGLGGGDTRPSAGRAAAPPASAARARLTGAAIAAGVDPVAADSVVRAVLTQISSTSWELPDRSPERVVAASLHALRSLVPEEAADVDAVLPQELRDLWQAGVAP